MAVTETELTLYQTSPPIVNNLNGVTAVEKVYPITEAKRVRKFTDSDIGLLNALYSVREGNEYLWRVKGVLEEFQKRTGKSISRSTLYRHVDQTRERRATALVLAAPTVSAIEAYSNPRGAVEEQPIFEKAVDVQLPERFDIRVDGTDKNYEAAFAGVRDGQIKQVNNRMEFYEHKRNWQGMIDTFNLATLWFNPYLWLDRVQFPNEEARTTFMKVYLPTLAIITNSGLVEKYRLALKKVNEKPNLVQRVLGIFRRDEQITRRTSVRAPAYA